MALDKERFRESTVFPEDYFSGNYIFGTLGKLLSRLFIRLPFTPNQITWLWGGLMVLSSLLFATGKYEYGIIAGALWIIAYAMDYVDGIVARYRDQRSPRGAYLDMIVHYTTYPMLMFCIGWGAYVTGGCSFMQNFDWFDDTWYVFLGIAAGTSISVFLNATPLYEKYKIGGLNFDGIHGSLGVEAKFVKNRDLFKLLMNFNPLVFTNMMVLLLVFAILDQMGLFIAFYGVCYVIVTIARVLIFYKDLGNTE